MGFCLICEKGSFQEKKLDYIQKIGTHTLQAPIIASVCVHCQNTLYPAQELQRANWIMAVQLARAGEIDKEGFRYLRGVLRLRVTDLGPMLGVTPTTISRWETGARTLDKKAAAMLVRMVLDVLGERGEQLNARPAHQRTKKLYTLRHASEKMKIALRCLTSLHVDGDDRLRCAVHEMMKIDGSDLSKEDRATFFGNIDRLYEMVAARLRNQNQSFISWGTVLSRMTPSEQDQLKEHLVEVAVRLELQYQHDSRGPELRQSSFGTTPNHF